MEPSALRFQRKYLIPISSAKNKEDISNVMKNIEFCLSYADYFSFCNPNFGYKFCSRDACNSLQGCAKAVLEGGDSDEVAAKFYKYFHENDPVDEGFVQRLLKIGAQMSLFCKSIHSLIFGLVWVRFAIPTNYFSSGSGHLISVRCKHLISEMTWIYLILSGNVDAMIHVDIYFAHKILHKKSKSEMNPDYLRYFIWDLKNGDTQQ